MTRQDLAQANQEKESLISYIEELGGASMQKGSSSVRALGSLESQGALSAPPSRREAEEKGMQESRHLELENENRLLADRVAQLESQFLDKASWQHAEDTTTKGGGRRASQLGQRSSKARLEVALAGERVARQKAEALQAQVADLQRLLGMKANDLGSAATVAAMEDEVEALRRQLRVLQTEYETSTRAWQRQQQTHVADQLERTAQARALRDQVVSFQHQLGVMRSELQERERDIAELQACLRVEEESRVQVEERYRSLLLSSKTRPRQVTIVKAEPPLLDSESRLVLGGARVAARSKADQQRVDRRLRRIEQLYADDAQAYGNEREATSTHSS